jgi:hypothetical protein
MVAVIKVTGGAKMPPNGSEMLLNAQVLFKFATPAPLAAAALGADAPTPTTTVDARGAITDLRLARTSTSAAPGGNGNGRLRMTMTWELTLQRDLVRTGAPLPVPNKAPAPTTANAWLTYDDPEGRFHFRHPQDMRPQAGDDFVQLGDNLANSTQGRVVTINLLNKTGDPEKDALYRDPEYQKKLLNDEWARDHSDVLHGPAGWLPEATWSPLKMKVYRIEAAQKPGDTANRNAARIFFDRYLVLFSRNESIVVDSFTGQDPPVTFRKQVEEILKTFVLSPSIAPPG